MTATTERGRRYVAAATAESCGGAQVAQPGSSQLDLRNGTRSAAAPELALAHALEWVM